MKLLLTPLAAALFALPLARCGEESAEQSACWKMGNDRDEAAIAAVGKWPDSPEKITCVGEIAAGENAYYGNN
jgi:hypothetical protein